MGIYEKPVYRLAGDRGLLIEFGDSIDPLVNDRVRAMGLALARAGLKGVREWVTSYCSLAVIYDPDTIRAGALRDALSRLEETIAVLNIPEPLTVEIPVCYGGDYGPDIGYVAEFNGLGIEEVIRLHSEPSYRIYMLGFTPGYPYLGGLSERLHTPRLATPRTLVPAGSVGIANAQTGIYSLDSPGGWRLIGRTPLKLFRPVRTPPFLFQPGDQLKFYPIVETEFKIIAGADNR